MAQQGNRIEITATLKSVREGATGKFSFRVVPKSGSSYRFVLTREKALKLANQDGDFPIGVHLRLRGQTRPSEKDGDAFVRGLNYVKILSVDGHDVQSWAEKHKSPTVAPEVLDEAIETIEAAEAEEEDMRRRAPPDPVPPFETPLAAYEGAMYIIRRQVRLKTPKLSKSEIWALRDALNFLKGRLGL